ncbi:MAG: dihydrolipoyl dehydrogenase [Deltaproteobacteria bacterium]|nr:dihydrolipoyl dehydrogenase [Deltaproteobacteria bacterium]
MSTQAKDLVVLGSGPGGYVAAIRASQLGRKVTIVEKSELGGVCLNWGCIPSKALLKSAHLFHDIKRSEEFGFSTTNVKLDFPKVIERSRGVAAKMEGGVNYLMKKNKVEIINGFGELQGGNRLTVTDNKGGQNTFTYKDIIIATGARARTLPNLEVDGKAVHTYRTMLEHKVLPQKLLVIGAGAIGMEFAYFFNSFGTKVTVVEMLPQILPVEDNEIAKGLERVLTKQGMTIMTGVKLEDLKQTGKTVSVTIKTDKGEEKWSGDTCLVAIGVVPNTEKIGLDKAKIATDQRGFIKADEFLRTNVPNHFAIGDVIGAPMLAHKASHEGIIAAEAACGKAHHPMKYDNIPGCTYCQPQVASIGLTEQACKEKGIKYRVGKIPFTAIGKAVAIGEPDGMCKVIIDDEIGEVLGVHILHSEATELIAEAAVIRTHEGIASSVVDTIHPHPTLSESMMEAMAAALGRPINF